MENGELGWKRYLLERTPELMDATGRFAVLVPLVRQGGELHLLYEVRGERLRNQPGEVCFPGGRMEGGESPTQCALRETWEELGIQSQEISVLGDLDFLVHRSNYILYPVLGVISEKGYSDMKMSRDEVAETFLVPLKYLKENPPQEYRYPLELKADSHFPYGIVGVSQDYTWKNGQDFIPVYPWKPHAIWGITGRITRHFIGLYQQWEEAHE